jgi:hypothetical protein
VLQGHFRTLGEACGNSLRGGLRSEASVARGTAHLTADSPPVEPSSPEPHNQGYEKPRENYGSNDVTTQAVPARGFPNDRQQSGHTDGGLDVRFGFVPVHKSAFTRQPSSSTVIVTPGQGARGRGHAIAS